ncbi:hypothetical protein BC938DRAFT_471455 [Jimgerdemannia flammicorona]|uniref:Uncharacterized protein n=1 Tax=Jimgerdemannia flammicorona TaxID=994334 RepID=A0A433QUK2_9FUNG|nr:hypothetical protein BC938DRAFT_471455 [Jimgerdemannia flammicorona]
MLIIYHHHGKYDKAAAVRTGARERVLQAEHRGTASSLNNLLLGYLRESVELAMLYDCQDKCDRTELLYELTKVGQEKTLEKKALGNNTISGRSGWTLQWPGMTR